MTDSASSFAVPPRPLSVGDVYRLASNYSDVLVTDVAEDQQTVEVLCGVRDEMIDINGFGLFLDSRPYQESASSLGALLGTIKPGKALRYRQVALERLEEAHRMEPIERILKAAQDFIEEHRELADRLAAVAKRNAAAPRIAVLALLESLCAGLGQVLAEEHGANLVAHVIAEARAGAAGKGRPTSADAAVDDVLSPAPGAGERP